ncbi:hypothetical protein CANMA_000461 [Candida margitis]|uniref:uncharacterized protein n=1 Tax=Candida margitis TaxID=1775924 RepID=UPI002226106E|nr:uncharacterized protein CANMA_000461 [Candida margitis]KAI5970552.1 hypothetical protein CANMA_000461 [Candida margitis]
MKWTYLTASLAIASAAQIPFELPNENNAFPFSDIDINALSWKDSFALHQEWTRNKVKYGKTKLLSMYSDYKQMFSAPRTDLTYGLTSSPTPELLGFDSVKQHSGYFTVEEAGKEFFYWFFESRNDPTTDPLILWLSGGPGCSSNIGLAMELGPSLINATIVPEFNPYSWNANASLLFLDQPANVGFSTGGAIPFTTEQAAIDFTNFVDLFRQKFPNYAHLDFHIAGESYAGHYIPKFAASVVEAGLPLKSVLIGNGITDVISQFKEVANMGCGKGGIGKIYTDEECESYDTYYQRFVPFGLLCYNYPNPVTCFVSVLASPNKPDSGDLNPYDSRIKCGDNPLCYTQLDDITNYFNNDKVQSALGVDKNFTACNAEVGITFVTDHNMPYHQYVGQLLEANIPVLIYAGDKDLVCDWLGNLAWVNALQYSGHEQFNATEFRPWVTKQGHKAGEVKNYKHFTYLRVYESGHMVPLDQPENALDMVNRWINGDLAFK